MELVRKTTTELPPYRCSSGATSGEGAQEVDYRRRHTNGGRQDTIRLWYTCAQNMHSCPTRALLQTLTERRATSIRLRQQLIEVLVVLARAYHQVLCIGSTLGEDVYYILVEWSIIDYAGCVASCPGTPTTNEHMGFRQPGALQPVRIGRTASRTTIGRVTQKASGSTFIQNLRASHSHRGSEAYDLYEKAEISWIERSMKYRKDHT